MRYSVANFSAATSQSEIARSSNSSGSQQIEAALDDTATKSPAGARRVRARHLVTLAMLQDFPHAGRATIKAGVRRIAATPLPYLIDYSVGVDEIIVRRFRHAPRKLIG